MDSRDEQGLMAEGYKVFRVAKYSPENDPRHKKAGEKVPDEFDLVGALHIEMETGRRLRAHVDIQDGRFVVYLPPKLPPSAEYTPGYAPSQKVAEIEFEGWLNRLRSC